MNLQFVFFTCITFLFVTSMYGIMITGEFDEIKMKEESELLPSLNDILLMDLGLTSSKVEN